MFHIRLIASLCLLTFLAMSVGCRHRCCSTRPAASAAPCCPSNGGAGGGAVIAPPGIGNPNF